MRNKKYSAMITLADISNSFSWFVISYFITVKHKHGSKDIDPKYIVFMCVNGK